MMEESWRWEEGRGSMDEIKEPGLGHYHLDWDVSCVVYKLVRTTLNVYHTGSKVAGTR